MDDAFDAYKSDPSPDGLIRLLRAHQDRVYRVCFQVLRRPHDAEDAAQETLMRIARGVRSIGDSESFHRWVYRISLNAALEVARKAARRRRHEARAAMTESPQPLDDESRRAVFEAVATLDDRTRGLLLDHHVEGETLEAISRREGITPQAVSKRLEKAREGLRRILPASLVAVDWGRVFSSDPVPPAPELLSGPVLATAVAAGGETAWVPKAALAWIAGVVIVGGTAALISVALRGEPVRESVRRDKKEPRTSQGGVEERGPSKAWLEAPPPRPEGSLQRVLNLSLAERLDRFKAWSAAWEKEKKELGDKLTLDQKFAFDHYTSRMTDLVHELEGIDKLIFAEPERFLAFLRDPENEPHINLLVTHCFGTVVPGVQMVKLPQSQYPPVLVDGMLGLLDTGTHGQKVAGLSFFAHMADPPGSFFPRFNALILDPDSRTQEHVLLNFWSWGMPKPDTEAAVLKAGRATTESSVRLAVIQATNWMGSPDVQPYLLERLEQSTDPQELGHLALALHSRMTISSRGGAAFDETRYVHAAIQALGRLGSDFDEGHLKYMISPALRIPATTARPLLARAAEVARTAECRSALQEVMRSQDEGVTDPEKLNQLLWPAKK